MPEASDALWGPTLGSGKGELRRLLVAFGAVVVDPAGERKGMLSPWAQVTPNDCSTPA